MILEIRDEIDEVLNNRFGNDFRMFSQERSESIIHNKSHINHHTVKPRNFERRLFEILANSK